MQTKRQTLQSPPALARRKGEHSMSKNEVYEAVRLFKEYQRMKEELEQEMEAIKDRIKVEFLAECVDELTVGEYKVRYTPVKVSRFDTAAFREAMPELAARFTRQVESRRFSVV